MLKVAPKIIKPFPIGSSKRRPEICAKRACPVGHKKAINIFGLLYIMKLHFSKITPFWGDNQTFFLQLSCSFLRPKA
jgi:hypothetical protein